MTRIYRDAYGIFACNGILYNHSSPRRGHNFVEQKIIQGALRIARGIQDTLYLGNLYSYRDFGHAKDYVRGIYLMMQQEQADDYVLATGHTHQIKDIVNIVFEFVGLPLTWSGNGFDEVGSHDGRVLVRIDEKFFRKTEVHHLAGDASKARNVLGWQPEYNLQAILEEMIAEETEKLDNTNK